MIRRGILTSGYLRGILTGYCTYVQLLIFCNDNNIFLGGGKLGILGGGTSTPLNTLERTLDGGSLLDRRPN